ncbi:MAG: hypothetical protein H0W96_04840 [Solirubrobacterales bacterium]|nr:hypothetical protein [Solirubrobacterales bacterium]
MFVFVFVEACEEVCELLAGEVPDERFRDLVAVALESFRARASSAVLLKSLGASSFRWMIEW